MAYRFTPAAERALQEAARWRQPDSPHEIEPAGLLIGLLAEPECRAALILSAHGIDLPAIRARWPGLSPKAAEHGHKPSRRPARALQLSPAVELSIQAAIERLWAYPRPLDLATEHLLLGLVASQQEVAAWLNEKGLQAERLEAEIHRLHGHSPEPVAIEATVVADAASVGADALSIRHEERSVSEERPPAALAHPEFPAIARIADQAGILRIFDAAANRAREGLRVIEDYVRMVLDDRHLTVLLKDLRHELTTVLSAVSFADRLACRETQADVGTAISTVTERERAGVAEVLAANFGRLTESLRSLEEYGKTLDPAMAARLEQLRYRVYTFERAVQITRVNLRRLEHARLYVLIDGRESPAALATLVESLVAARVDVIQLRDKHLADAALLERARLIADRTAGTRTLFMMNDRPDLAVLARADGVHVGQEELSVKDVRAVVGPGLLIGVSTHSLAQARQAVLDGADYLGVGPTFRSGTKQFDHYPGLELVRAVTAEIRLPAFVIGGITAANLPQVLSAGGARIAVSGAVSATADPVRAVSELRALLIVRTSQE